MNAPQAGDKAPDFKLPDAQGQTLALKDLLKKGRVVLYFYPKDDTPGCTVQACGFRDGWSALRKSGSTVIGISPDGRAAHAKFAGKYDLPFTLLSDEDKEVCKAYGVWVKKSMYGREYMGVARTTFIIGRDGRIEKVFEKVKPEGHTAEVLAALTGKSVAAQK